MKTKECKTCDYDNPIKKGRAYYVCKDCGRDITLELVLIEKAYERCDKAMEGFMNKK